MISPDHVPHRRRVHRPVRPGGGRAARRTASPCGSASRSSATSSTTATSWSAASTPTPTCCSRKAMDLHDLGPRPRRGGRGAGPHPGARSWHRHLAATCCTRRTSSDELVDGRARPPAASRATPRSTAPTATTASSSRPTQVGADGAGLHRPCRRDATHDPRSRAMSDRQDLHPETTRHQVGRAATTARRWPRCCGPRRLS